MSAFRWYALTAMGALLPAIGQGQRPVATASHIEQTITSQAILSRPVSVVLQNATLRSALDEIAAKGGVHMQYQSALVDGVARPISMDVKDQPLKQVLDVALAGTGLRVEPVEGSLLAIIRGGVQRVANGVIVGRVVNAKTKQPVVGATVQVGEVRKTTGKDGRVRFDVPAGSVTIHVRAVGLTRQSKTVDVPADGTITIDFEMESSASVLDEVIVTGTVVATARKEIPNPITVITAEEIERRGIQRLEEFFRGEVPGIFSVERGEESYKLSNPALGSPSELGVDVTAKIYARGSSNLQDDPSLPAGMGAPNPLKTYIDGVEMFDPSLLGTIDPNTIERIEIITGPQAATIYGSGAMGGVMQIFTKRGNAAGTREVRLNLRYGMLQNSIGDGLAPNHNHAISINGGNGPLRYTGTASYQYTGQWQPSLFSRAYGGSVGLSYQSGATTLRSSVVVRQGSSGTTLHGFAGPTFLANAATGEWRRNNSYSYGFSTNRVSVSESQNVSLEADYKHSDNWSQHFTVGWNNSNLAIDPVAPYLLRPQDTLFEVRNSAGRRKSGGYNTTLRLLPDHVVSSVLTFGVNGSTGTLQSVDGCIGSKLDRNLIRGCHVNLSGIRANNPIVKSSYGAFGTTRVGLLDHVFLTLGLRAEKNNAYGQRHSIDWTPTNGLTFVKDVRDITVKLFGSYGKATRPPEERMREEVRSYYAFYEPNQWISILGNPDLRPEYSRGPQGGVEVYVGRYGSISVNHFHQKVTDLIQTVWGVDTVLLMDIRDGAILERSQQQYQNTASIRQRGWETQLHANIGPVTTKVTHSWVDSRVIALKSYAAGASDFYPGMLFSAVPTHTGHFSISYARGKSSISLNSNFVGKASFGLGGHLIYLWSSNSRITTYVDNRKGTGGAKYAKPGYVKSDVNVSHRLSRNVSLSLNIVNVTNRFDSDVRVATSPSLGRRTTFVLSLTR